MAQALIRKIDDETLADYRAAAAKKGRSLEAELRDLIERNRPGRKMDRSARVALARELQALTPNDVRQSDSTEYIRQLRDTDSGGSFDQDLDAAGP